MRRAVTYTLSDITITNSNEPTKKKKKFWKTLETMEGYCSVIFI
jgi:hypothetical protein